MVTTGRFDRGDGVELAWARQDGRGPTVVFLPGFRSDMNGEKATTLAAFCAERGQAMLRLDYSGHGSSGGETVDDRHQEGRCTRPLPGTAGRPEPEGSSRRRSKDRLLFRSVPIVRVPPFGIASRALIAMFNRAASS